MPLFPQRNPTTGSRLYTNADLNQRPALEPDMAEPAAPVANPPQHQAGDVPIEYLLAMAKNTLGRGDHLAAEHDAPADDGSVAAYNADAPSVTDSASTRFGRFARQQGSRMWNNAKTVAPVMAFMGGPLGAAADAVMAGGAAQDMATEGPSLGKGAMLAGGAIGALRGLTGVTKALNTERFAGEMDALGAAKSAKQADTVRETVNTARDYRHAGASTEQAGQRAGWPLGRSEQTSVVNHSAPGYAPDPISELMDGQGGAYQRRQNPMDALKRHGSRQTSRPSQAVATGTNNYAPFTNQDLANGGSRGYDVELPAARQEIAALRNLIRSQVR